MDIWKYRAWITLYPIAFFVAVVFSVAMIASVTNIVVFESSGFTFERELYLEHIRKEVERRIPLAIALDCVALFLEYKFLARLARRTEIEKAIDFTIGTYIVTLAVWLSYAMFHGLSGEYPPMALAVTLLSLGVMVACGVFFYVGCKEHSAKIRGHNPIQLKFPFRVRCCIILNTLSYLTEGSLPFFCLSNRR